MRRRAVLFALPALVLLLAGGAFLLRERIADYWIQTRLAQRLSDALGADVEVEGARWRSGLLQAQVLRIAGGDLPFENLEARGVKAAVGWNALLEPAEEPLHVEADEAHVVWHDRTGRDARGNNEAGAAGTAPPLDVFVNRLNFRHRDLADWSVEGSTVRAVNRDGTWSLSGQGGEIRIPPRDPLALRHFSAEHTGGRWRIGSVAVEDPRGGVLGGSAARDEDGSWSGRFSWKDIEIAPLLPQDAARHIEGTSSGDALLANGTLTGRMKIRDARTHAVGLFVKLASLLDREDWSTVPWRVFHFDFKRHADGRFEFSDLQALSEKGVAVRGAGGYAPENIAAELQFGVLREGRPYLAAFMPVLFSHERDGYLWTSVKVGGTPQAPTENLSARVAEALAVVPATGVIDSAVEAPAAAGEAVDGLLRGLLHR